jgi:hypothetical protein
MTDKIINYKNGLDQFKLFFNNRRGEDQGKKSHTILTMRLVMMQPQFHITERKVDLHDLIDFSPFVDQLEQYGLYLNTATISILIKNYPKLLKLLYPEYEIKDCQNHEEKGHPDFILTYKGDSPESGHEFYIEFKKNNDGIHKSQLDWLFKNPDKEVYFLFVNEEDRW